MIFSGDVLKTLEAVYEGTVDAKAPTYLECLRLGLVKKSNGKAELTLDGKEVYIFGLRLLVKSAGLSFVPELPTSGSGGKNGLEDPKR